MKHTGQTMRRLPSLMAAIIALAPLPSFAVDALDAADLKEQCSDFDVAAGGESAPVCVAFVTGFLDGAVVTDARVAENVANEIDAEESFSERAIRTRVIRRLEVAGPTGYADFCVGQPVPVGDVIEHVIAEFASHTSLAGLAARDIVYDALRRHYPCRR